VIDGFISFAEARGRQPAALAAAITRLTGSITEFAGRRTGPGPIFVAIGASHAAACAPVWALRTRGIHSWRLGAGDHPLPFPASTHPVFGVSQSGRSAETLAVLETVDPALRYAVVNAVPSPIADVATHVIGLGSIPDSYASTIGYTATVAALGMLADAWDGGRIDDGWSRLGDVLGTVERDLRDGVRSLAPLFASATSADFVGEGPAVGSAEASALLFREVARIPSTGMSTRQYLHGSMESAGNGVVHVLFGGERERAIAHTLGCAGHPAILVTSDEVDGGANVYPVRVPALPPAQRAILEILVTQLLVEAVAEVRGLDIEEFVFHNADIKVAGV
jgi:glucosamine--fructose-6-phosphate aminotransferase (isomerizing)